MFLVMQLDAPKRGCQVEHGGMRIMKEPWPWNVCRYFYCMEVCCRFSYNYEVIRGLCAPRQLHLTSLLQQG